MNIFQTVKENVTARQAAEQYGLKINENANPPAMLGRIV